MRARERAVLARFSASTGSRGRTPWATSFRMFRSVSATATVSFGIKSCSANLRITCTGFGFGYLIPAVGAASFAADSSWPYASRKSIVGSTMRGGDGNCGDPGAFAMTPSASELALSDSLATSSPNLTEAPAADISRIRGIRFVIGFRNIINPVTATAGHANVWTYASTSVGALI